MSSEYIIARRRAAKMGATPAWIGQAIQAGTSIFSQLMAGGGGSGGGGGVARGLAAIQSATGQIIQALEAIRAQVGQGNYQELYAQAQRLVAALSDPSVIYQAQRGEDAAVLRRAKDRAGQILQEISTAGANVSPVQTIPNQTGQVVTAGGNFIQDIFQDRTMLYLAAGGVLVYLLTRKK